MTITATPISNGTREERGATSALSSAATESWGRDRRGAEGGASSGRASRFGAGAAAGSIAWATDGEDRGTGAGSMEGEDLGAGAGSAGFAIEGDEGFVAGTAAST